tara:strand:+ start:1401 stop:1613 length:213 start_codon:yes stop_codon:yes gene_type:complete
MTSLNRPRSSIINYHHLISKLSDEDIRTILEKNFKEENTNKSKNKNSAIFKRKSIKTKIIKKILRYVKCI